MSGRRTEPKIGPQAWRDRGAMIELTEGRVFFVDLGPRADPTPILVLHGFPTSSWDFAEAATRLAGRRRVILLDFLGFGLSDKPRDHGYSLFEHADVALAVVRRTGLVRAHVWAHDMGTSVATELLARRERGLLPFELGSLVLMNGSVHLELAHLTTGQRLLASPVGGLFARIAGRRVFGAQMKRIFGRAPDEQTLDGMWSLLARAEGTRRLPATIRYLDERIRHARRWIGALERLDRPALVAWGTRDPVALEAIADRLAREIPGATTLRWKDLGHYPQVEDPARVADAIDAFLVRRDRPLGVASVDEGPPEDRTTRTSGTTR